MPQLLCPWEAPAFLIFSDNIPVLFFYSHIPGMFIALALGIFVFLKSRDSGVARSLLVLASLFFVWSFADLILWATNDPRAVLFFWSLQVLIEPLVFLVGLLLAYRFIYKSEPTFLQKAIAVLPMLPLLLFLPTRHNLLGVDLADCTAVEGFFAQYYSYALETVILLVLALVVAKAYRNTKDRNRRAEATIFGAGVICFLAAFSWGNIVGSFSSDWVTAQLGLMGMPIFMAFLSYTIVRFHTFDIKVFATQGLVAVTAVLIGAQLFSPSSLLEEVLTAATLLIFLTCGWFLVRSVKKEVEQREKLELLAADLERSLQQRESLAHLITHKIKGVFTRSMGIFSEMCDGTFGALPPALEGMAKRGLESDKEGIQTVDLVLNASNLTKGTIKFEKVPVDLQAIVAKITAEKKAAAEAKGLTLEVAYVTGGFTTPGDPFWLSEVVRNLIDNAIRYTLAGSVSVKLERKGQTLLFSVKDTGVGITAEDKKNLFREGGRGKESVKINVDSTGYGLYTVKLIVDAHKGKVWADSEGNRKGTTFFVELGTENSN